jgi:septal ring factor EnvC (AmiA/AmiB activator)
VYNVQCTMHCLILLQLLGTIDNLRVRCQSYVVENETMKSELETNRRMSSQKISRLEEEIETQSELVRTLQNQLRLYKSKCNELEVETIEIQKFDGFCQTEIDSIPPTQLVSRSTQVFVTISI